MIKSAISHVKLSHVNNYKIFEAEIFAFFVPPSKSVLEKNKFLIEKPNSFEEKHSDV